MITSSKCRSFKDVPIMNMNAEAAFHSLLPPVAWCCTGAVSF